MVDALSHYLRKQQGNIKLSTHYAQITTTLRLSGNIHPEHGKNKLKFNDKQT